EPQRNSRRVIHDPLDLGRVEVDTRIDRERVTGVHAGPLDVLHDARHQHLLAVTDRVDLDLLADKVFVDEDRVLRRQVDLVPYVPGEVIRAVDNLHRSSAEDVAWPYQHRVADAVCDRLGVGQ